MGWALINGVSINSSGQIVCDVRIERHSYGCLLTPTPLANRVLRASPAPPIRSEPVSRAPVVRPSTKK